MFFKRVESTNQFGGKVWPIDVVGANLKKDEELYPHLPVPYIFGTRDPSSYLIYRLAWEQIVTV